MCAALPSLLIQVSTLCSWRAQTRILPLSMSAPYRPAVGIPWPMQMGRAAVLHQQVRRFGVSSHPMRQI